jgi:hypothetical protein
MKMATHIMCRPILSCFASINMQHLCTAAVALFYNILTASSSTGKYFCGLEFVELAVNCNGMKYLKLFSSINAEVIQMFTWFLGD